jgi:flagellar biosynthesis protein FliQ
MAIALVTLTIVLVWALVRLVISVITSVFKQASQIHHEVTSGDFPPQIG